jgi:hypothetical protein
LIEDPDKATGRPHIGTEQQIADLITVLTNPRWIDFSLAKNQVVAKFFDAPDQHKKQEFFHQLLLSVELYQDTDVFHSEYLQLRAEKQEQAKGGIESVCIDTEVAEHGRG